MRAVSEAVVMLTPRVKEMSFIPTPTSPTPAIESRSFRPTSRPRPSENATSRSKSPAMRNRIATNGSGGTSRTASFTATGLVPRKRTARSRETSVSTAALLLSSVTISDSTLRRRSSARRAPAAPGKDPRGMLRAHLRGHPTTRRSNEQSAPTGSLPRVETRCDHARLGRCEEGGPKDGHLRVGRRWLARGLVLAEGRPPTQRGGPRRLSRHPHRPRRTGAPRFSPSRPRDPYNRRGQPHRVRGPPRRRAPGAQLRRSRGNGRGGQDPRAHLPARVPGHRADPQWNRPHRDVPDRGQKSYRAAGGRVGWRLAVLRAATGRAGYLWQPGRAGRRQARTAALPGRGPAVRNLYAAAAVGEPCQGGTAEGRYPVQLLPGRGTGDHRQRKPRVPRNGEP